MSNLLSADADRASHPVAGSVSKLEINMDQLLFNLNSAFNPLHRDCLVDYHVQAVDTRNICMSVVMPNEMLHSFSLLLESMGGFFRLANNKARSSSAVVKAHDLGEMAKREETINFYKKEVVELYDSFTSQGHDRKDALKLTNRALRAKEHPWSSTYIIEKVLRSAGRFRKTNNEKGEK